MQFREITLLKITRNTCIYSVIKIKEFILMFEYLEHISTQPPILWVLGALSLGVKWPRREADHSSPSSAEVKNGGAIPPLSHTSSWRSI
jgi:hypothetical protein